MAAPDIYTYCPYCAHLLQHKQLEGKLRPFCATCERVFFQDPKVAAAILIEEKGKLLLVQRDNVPGRGKWTLPAGFVDAGEDPKLAAERECYEETGLDVSAIELLDIIHGKEHERGADFVILYKGIVNTGQLTPGDDAQDVAFFGPDELPPIAFKATHRAIKDWLSSLKEN